jgi:hypothetical protein
MDENTFWVPISKVPENQRDELRTDMVAGRVRFRYLNAASFRAAIDENQPPPPRQYVESDPGAAFWHCARINWTWSTAVAGSVVISGLEVRIDGGFATEPHASSRLWKALIHTEFESRLNGGEFHTRKGMAIDLQKWLQETHNIQITYYTIQNELPPRRSWNTKK